MTVLHNPTSGPPRAAIIKALQEARDSAARALRNLHSLENPSAPTCLDPVASPRERLRFHPDLTQSLVRASPPTRRDPGFLSPSRPWRALRDKLFSIHYPKHSLRPIELQNDPTEPPKTALSGENQRLNGARQSRTQACVSEAARGSEI